jgi:hypothetical protein
MPAHRRLSIPLVAGDLLAVLALSLIGFFFHNDEFSWRWLATFLPACAAWALIAPWIGVYQAELTARPLQVWRPALSGFLSAPLAAWLRGLWLNAAISPVFVLVLGLTTAAGMALWRLAWALFNHRTPDNG